MTHSPKLLETLSRRNERLYPRIYGLVSSITVGAAAWTFPVLLTVDPSIVYYLSTIVVAFITFLGIWLVVLFTGTQRVRIEQLKKSASFVHLVDDFVEAFKVFFGVLFWLGLVTAYGKVPALYPIVPVIVFGVTVGSVTYAAFCLTRVIWTLVGLVRQEFSQGVVP